MRSIGSLHLALGTLATLCAAPSAALAHTPPQRFALLRPTWEFSSWVGLGGGGLVGADRATGVFDMRLGGDATVAIGRKGNLRLGPFVEVTTATFAGVGAYGGVEVFVGAVPRPLRMFYYSGEGVFSARLGAGWAWRGGDLPGAGSTPSASVTFTYGYRCPFSLREYENQYSEVPDRRAAGRYMIGARLWVGAAVDLRDGPAWQVTGGIEFEPVGAFRYLLGLY